MQERWDLVEQFPDQLRSYVPVFTAFTDSAFSTEASVDQGLRVALRYEVGRFFASVEQKHGPEQLIPYMIFSECVHQKKLCEKLVFIFSGCIV